MIIGKRKKAVKKDFLINNNIEVIMSKDLRINIRISPEEKNLIDKKAEGLGQSTSDFARDTLLEVCSSNENQKENYQDISLQLMTYSYKLIDKLSKDRFDIKEINSLKRECDETMKEWGYNTE